MISKVRSAFTLLFGLSLVYGLSLDTHSLLGGFSQVLYSAHGPLGFALLVGAVVGYAFADFHSWKDSRIHFRWSVLAYLALLPTLAFVGLGGTLGETLNLTLMAIVGSQPLVFMALATALGGGAYMQWFTVDRAQKLDIAYYGVDTYLEEKETERLRALEVPKPAPRSAAPKVFKPITVVPKVEPHPRDYHRPNTNRRVFSRVVPPAPKTVPPLSILGSFCEEATQYNPTEVQSRGQDLVDLLSNFNIQATLNDYIVGPTVTTYRLVVAEGVRYNRILNLNREIMGALESESIRIVAPIPGTNFVGVEVPNKKRLTVGFRALMEHYTPDMGPLHVAIGKSNSNQVVITDLRKTPHLLVAGTTGSGKSVCLNGIIGSLLMRNTPETLKLVLIDPKQNEFKSYEGLPHLWTDIVYNDPIKASRVLRSLVQEMERRYTQMGSSKNIADFNEKGGKMPYIVVVVEEFADLVMLDREEKKKPKAERDPNYVPLMESIARIAQKARACGIHIVLATQRPSTDVVDGVVKANFPSRIACKVMSGVDSKVMLDQVGAENLIGNGDMLYLPSDSSAPERLQGLFITGDDIHAVVNHYKG